MFTKTKNFAKPSLLVYNGSKSVLCITIWDENLVTLSFYDPILYFNETGFISESGTPKNLSFGS